MTILGIFRPRASGENVSRGRRRPSLLAALLLALALPVAASAYTLVLRNGRRVIIPDQFRATATAIIYEAAPGITVTVQLATVDAAATEQANGEPAGGFLKRVQQRVSPEKQTSPAATGRKVLTNRDLEASRVKREEADREYERTRAARNLMSKEELRQRIEEQDRQLEELSLQVEAARAAAREEALRAELSIVNRQLHELRGQLAAPPAAAPVYAAPYFYSNSYPVTSYYPSYGSTSPLITVGVGGVNREVIFGYNLKRPHPFPPYGWSPRSHHRQPWWSRSRDHQPRAPQGLVPAPRMRLPRR